MMSISVFAGSTGLSVKALRFYDERGLLRPAEVDPVTGYRSYSASQLRDARTIRVLRAAGMPLEAIGRALAEPDTIGELLRSHRARLDEERRLQDRALALALSAEQPPREPEILTRKVGATHFAAVVHELETELADEDVEASNDEASALLGRLYRALEESGNLPVGGFWTGMPLTGSAGPFRLRLAWPVATPASVSVDGLEVVCGTLPARTEAFLQGAPDGTDQLEELGGGPLPDPRWIALAEHCEASGVEPDELRQSSTGTDENDWRVEYAVTIG